MAENEHNAGGRKMTVFRTAWEIEQERLARKRTLAGQTMSQITDEQVEAACQAFTSDWADQDDYAKEHYRKNMRAALETLSTPPVGAPVAAPNWTECCNMSPEVCDCANPKHIHVKFTP